MDALRFDILARMVGYGSRRGALKAAAAGGLAALFTRERAEARRGKKKKRCPNSPNCPSNPCAGKNYCSDTSPECGQDCNCFVRVDGTNVCATLVTTTAGSCDFCDPDLGEVCAYGGFDNCDPGPFACVTPC
ncbi:MAG: hypothetical protein H0V00_09215 [Chloroflexia bacterium]|nr:hypothetical protein [Chloroflexia bacterium]